MCGAWAACYSLSCMACRHLSGCAAHSLGVLPHENADILTSRVKYPLRALLALLFIRAHAPYDNAGAWRG